MCEAQYYMAIIAVRYRISFSWILTAANLQRRKGSIYRWWIKTLWSQMGFGEGGRGGMLYGKEGEEEREWEKDIGATLVHSLEMYM